MNTIFHSKELTFGSDPETAAVYYKDNKEFVEPPAYFRFELNAPYKDDPKHPVFIEQNGIIVMEDGCAFEYTLPPVKESRTLYEEIQLANLMLDKFLNRYGYIRVSKPVINYDVNKFKDKSDEYKLCLIFGCDADRDAIEENYNCQVEDALLHPYRYFGGHIQVGSFNPDVVEFLHMYWQPMIRLMAIFVGLNSIGDTLYPELEIQRATRYGRPGRYRIQKWGLEYRTPSCSWTNSQVTLDKMISGIKVAFILLQNPKIGKEVLGECLDNAIQAIKTADSELARTTLQDAYGIYYKGLH